MLDSQKDFETQDTIVARDGTTIRCIVPLPGGGEADCSSFLQNNRHDMNISVSRGCPMKCPTCMSGVPPLERMFTDDEIVQQVIALIAERQEAGECFADTEYVVGTFADGEPATNYRNVLKAFERLLELKNPSISHITTCTTGVKYKDFLPPLTDLAKSTGRVNLQYSLFSLDPETKKILVPKAPTLEEILPSLLEFAKYGELRCNVPLVGDMTDSEQHIRRLAELSNQTGLTIKISTLNEFKGIPYPAADTEIFNKRTELLRSLIKQKPKIFRSSQTGLPVHCGVTNLATRPAVYEILQN